MNTMRSDIILYYVVSIISNIAGSGETYQNKLCNLNFIPTILDVLMSNYNNKNLVIILLSSLMNITYNNMFSSDLAIQFNAFNKLISIFNRTKEDEVKVALLLLINNLLTVSTKFHKLFINEKGVYPLINNLDNSNVMIQLYCVKGLSILCTDANVNNDLESYQIPIYLQQVLYKTSNFEIKETINAMVKYRNKKGANCVIF